MPKELCRWIRAFGWVLVVGLAVSTRGVGAQDIEALDAYIGAAIAEWEVPGMAVAVVRGQDLLLAKGYGVLDLDADGVAQVNEASLFSVGSTTKALTAAGVGVLVDDGLVAWDDPVTKHLPWFELEDPYVTREITVRDLLTHRAGLGNADFLWYEQPASRQDIVERVRFAPMAYSMRSSFIYQNIMYSTAGSLIEAVSGQSWEAFTKERLLDPMGMTNTVTTIAETEGLENVARPHHRVDGTLVRINNASVDNVAAAGSIWSSVEDMSKWLRVVLADGVTPEGVRVLEEETVKELLTPQTLVPEAQFYPTRTLTQPAWTSYGMGWFQHDYRGRKLDCHTGSIDGMVAIAGLIKSEDIAVYVLGNLDHAEVRHAIMYRALDALMGEEERDWHQEVFDLYAAVRRGIITQTTESDGTGLEPDDLVGTYEDALFGKVEVWTGGEGLWLRYGEGLQGPLQHTTQTVYHVPWETAWRGRGTVIFELNGSGRVEALRLNGSRFRRSR